EGGDRRAVGCRDVRIDDDALDDGLLLDRAAPVDRLLRRRGGGGESEQRGGGDAVHAAGPQSERISGGGGSVGSTTQYCSVCSRSVRSCSGVAEGADTSNRMRIRSNPTGTSRETPSVPRRSRSPSTSTWMRSASIPSAVATSWQVIWAHAASAPRS